MKPRRSINLNVLATLALIAGTFLAVGPTPAEAQDPALPVGWHDGPEGVVGAEACSAFGWAVDPDNRDADLQVQILADGNPVAQGIASLPREDLAECPEGTCGFGVSLWGLISAGAEHQITAQAFDPETQAWVDLPGTPKSLTCWGFPEGFHDGAEGIVGQDACYASGWAADPDDRDRNLQVQILSDGSVVATTTADLLREDVGACTGGTCGFFADLWGLILPDTAHQITVQANDQETSSWLNLEATPKSLTCTSPPPVAPSIWVSTSNDYLHGNDFTPGATLTFTVYDSTSALDPFLTLSRTLDVNGYAFIDGWEHGMDLVVGNYVVGSDGFFTRTLVLEPLTIDVFDPGTDSVAGTASPGELVHVVIGNNDVGYPPEGDMTVYADDGEVWTADYTGQFDIPWDMWASAEVADEDWDWTVFHLGATPPPSPGRFTVFTGPDSIQAWEWPEGESVNLAIDDPNTEATPDYEADATVGPAPWDENQILANFEFAGEYDVKPGDIVTVSHNDLSAVYEVEPIAVTGLDTEADTIAGTAAAGETVYVWQHGEDWAIQQPTADTDGNWTADFSTAEFDLQPGACGRAEVRDDAGNSTAEDWCVPIPRFTAFPEGEIIEGWDWPLDAVMHMTIDDPSTEASPDFTKDGMVILAPWDPGVRWLWIEFPGEYDLKPGDVVTVTDDATPRTHVVEVLSVGSPDAGENTVTGLASPSRRITLWSWEDPEGRRLETTADGSGAWVVDFDDVGLDLAPGQHVRAEVWDEGGNDTAIDRDVPMLIRIDIRPWNNANLVACRATWDLLPVAVLSTADFDATAIDHDSVRFGRTGTEAEVVVLWGRPLRYARDVNGDRLVDMVYTFRFGETGFGCADIPAGGHTTTVVGTLRGWLNSIRIEGSDKLTLIRLLGH